MFGSGRQLNDDIMPTRFVRSSPQRATVGPLKQPKLPGAERFRFNRSTENLSAPVSPIASSRSAATATATTTNNSATVRRRPTSPPPPIPIGATPTSYDRHRQSLTTGHRQSSSRYPASTTTIGSNNCSTGPPFRQPVYYFQQNRLGSSGTSSESSGRRKPIIPISKHTSRVLNNTNVELSADAIEFIKSETSRINNICKTYIVPAATSSGTATPTRSSASASNESDVDGSDSGASSLSSSSSTRSSGCSLDRNGRFWMPGLTAGRRSPPAPSTAAEDEFGGETVAVRNGSYVPVRYSPPASDPCRSVTGLATFRPRSSVVQQTDDARTQSSGSLASVEGDDRNWMRIRRTRTGSSTGSPSPTQSVCSSDSNDNPWILRTDCV